MQVVVLHDDYLVFGLFELTLKLLVSALHHLIELLLKLLLVDQVGFRFLHLALLALISGIIAGDVRNLILLYCF